MEFGEKLKTVREEKGMTQQTLAEHLFVTRQAVSRWESGSRYPDLMTSKKIADFLEISLDELVSGDDWKDFAEKQPIIENAKTGRIQTACYAAAFILWLAGTGLSLLETVWIICNGELDGLRFRYTYTYPSSENVAVLMGTDIFEMAVSAFILVLLAYGTIMSVKKSVNPKLAGSIIGCFFAEGLIRSLFGIVSIFSLQSSTGSNLITGMLKLLIGRRVILYAPGLVFVILFFFTKKRIPAWTVYATLGLTILYHLFAVASNIVWLWDTDYGWSKNAASTLLSALPIICIMGLGIVQAWIISRKRKLGAAV